MADFKEKLGLYIHVPFCRSKCIYCDFYSKPCKKDTDYKRYVDSLILHMEDYSKAASDMLVDTVFIGGGTPSILPVKQIGDLLNGVYRNFNVDTNSEITIEANPATVDRAAMKRYIAEGINRFSFGLQSANDNELRALSRIHTFDDFVDTFNDARKAKCKNINVDIMYGLPSQTLQSLIKTLAEVTSLEPEHISLYGLKVEEGTPLAKNADVMQLPDEDTEYEMYMTAIDYLASKGYRQYEISNFAKPGYECRHNLKYWRCEPYLGLGPAAHSYFGNQRFSFKRDLDAYMDALELTEYEKSITDECYDVPERDRMGEYIMLRLRLNEGIKTDDFKRRFGRDFDRIYEKALAVYIENGYMKKGQGSYSFTPKGMYVSNYILAAMLDFDSILTENVNTGVCSLK